MDVTHIFGAADQLTNTKLNDNYGDFTELVSGGLKTGNFHPDAGIVSTQLADRYAFSAVGGTYNLVPYRSGNYSGATEYQMPATLTQVAKIEVQAPSGWEGFLTYYYIHVEDVTVDGTKWPTFELRKNGTVVGSTIVLDADDKEFRVAPANKVRSVLVALADLDLLTFWLGQEAGGTLATVGGLTVRLGDKWRLVD